MGMKSIVVHKASKQVEPGINLTADDVIERPKDDEGNDVIAVLKDLSGKNGIHGRCIAVKVACTVGLMQVDDEKAAEVINDNGDSLFDVLHRAATDLEDVGAGVIEVVRNNAGRIAELYYMPAVELYRTRNKKKPFLQLAEGAMRGVPFARYMPDATDKNSLLVIDHPSTRNRHYPLPEWEGVRGDIELENAAAQFNRAAFENGGVPDIAIIVEGGEFDEDTEKEVQDFLASNLKGVSNARRVLYIPVSAPDVKVKIEKLGMDRQKDGDYDQLRQRSRDNIISSHGVPPRLLGIVQAGSLGGGGEAEGQLEIFDKIWVQPRQKLWQRKLTPLLAELETAISVEFNGLDITPAEPEPAPITLRKVRNAITYGGQL